MVLSFWQVFTKYTGIEDLNPNDANAKLIWGKWNNNVLQHNRDCGISFSLSCTVLEASLILLATHQESPEFTNLTLDVLEGVIQVFVYVQLKIPYNLIPDSVQLKSASPLNIGPLNVCLFCIKCQSSQMATFSIDRCLLSRMSRQHVSCGPGFENTTNHCEDKDSPAKAEESKVDAQQCGHHMPHKRTGLAGVQIESEPNCREQSTELTYYEVYLKEKDTKKE